MKQTNIWLTKEEIRIIHQALNEICNGINLSDSEFETRIGTEREAAISLMTKLANYYEDEF